MALTFKRLNHSQGRPHLPLKVGNMWHHKFRLLGKIWWFLQLCFFICGPWAKILATSFYDDILNLTPWASKEEMLISWLLGLKQKNKDTFFSSIVKVWQSKVSLLLSFVAQEPRYDHFFFWSSGCKVCAIFRGRKCQYLDSWATN